MMAMQQQLDFIAYIQRLQILAKQEECFLYPHTKGKSYITLNAGIAACFRRFYDLVVYLAKNAWLQIS